MRLRHHFTWVVLSALTVAFGSCGPGELTVPADAGPGPGESDGGECSDTWETYGQAFIGASCASCHTYNHGALADRATVLRQSALIVDRVSKGTMPPGATLSTDERARFLRFMACGVPTTTLDAGVPFEVVTARAAVAKVKDLLVGLPATDSEVAAVSVNPKVLATLIEEWTALPQYHEKMMAFFELAFQQTQITSVNFVELIPGQGLGNGATVPLLIENVRESFARTVLALDAEGRPLTEAFTTHRVMMTPALMELYAFLDAWQVNDQGKAVDAWASLFQKRSIVLRNDGGPVPLGVAADAGSPLFLTFYDPDVGHLVYGGAEDCQTDPITITATSYTLQRALYGAVPGHSVGLADGGTLNCPERGGTVAGSQLTPDDFTTWRMVTIRPPVGTESITHFYELPRLRTATELVLKTPRPGFFSTPGFAANWPTNQSNQMRVTINQALIVATGMAIDGLDLTATPTTPGLDTEHASDPACYSCHRILDPTKAILSSTYSWFYGPQTDAALVAEKGIFQFQGLVKPVASIDDFASALAAHPAVPAAWAQKLCEYANSAPCQRDDPEFARVVAAFTQANGSWSALVRELLSSPLVTNLAPSVTYATQGEIIAVSRRDHLCAALDARLRLNDVCGRRGAAPGLIPQIAAGLPSDGYGRGATEPVLPNTPTLFYRAGLENICASVAQLVVDAAFRADQPNAVRWSSASVDPALDDFATSLLGLNSTDARWAPARAVLSKHYSDARKTASATDALRSTFVLACLSPSFVGVGL